MNDLITYAFSLLRNLIISQCMRHAATGWCYCGNSYSWPFPCVLGDQAEFQIVALERAAVGVSSVASVC